MIVAQVPRTPQTEQLIERVRASLARNGIRRGNTLTHCLPLHAHMVALQQEGMSVVSEIPGQDTENYPPSLDGLLPESEGKPYTVRLHETEKTHTYLTMFAPDSPLVHALARASYHSLLITDWYFTERLHGNAPGILGADGTSFRELEFIFQPDSPSLRIIR